jgi:hypothetical protein
MAGRSRILFAPRSALSRWPMVGVNLRRWGLEWWTTTGEPGRLIRVGPLWLRWGAA